MAGMLPGVEAARRRRIHQKSNQCYGSKPSPAAFGYGGTRRSSFCLYVSSHDFHLCSSTRRHTVCDESKLGAEAREAKKRLDERLWRSESSCCSRGKGGEEAKVQKSGWKKKVSWLKMMRWRREEEECVVCLEGIKAEAEDTLMQLGCGHRFHAHCLLPWLHANNHCPCCRMQTPIPPIL